MKKQFILEVLVGIIGLAIVIPYGFIGFSVIALFAIQPFIKEKKLSKNQKSVFNQASNYTLMLLFFVMIVIFYFSDISINSVIIGENWLPLICFSIFTLHGISGLFLIKANLN